MNLHNETLVNVAALLQEPVGAVRQYDVTFDSLDLGDDLQATDFNGELTLTRLSGEILAQLRGKFQIVLECQRCLEPFEQPDKVDFTESYLISVDLRTGDETELDDDETDESLMVSHAHEIDLGESLRQEILVEMPMRPICRPDCEGLVSEIQAEEEEIDSRFAALSQLLNE